MNWVELFGSREYEFPTEIEIGSSFVGGANHPDAVVVAADVQCPQRILVQRMELDVSDETDRRERIRVTRVVAELYLGELVELLRVAQPVESDDAVDTSTCAGCGAKIVEGQHVVIDGAAYHKRCVSESEEERHDRRGRRGDGADRRGAAGGNRGDREGVEEADGPRVPSAPSPKTVTKALREKTLGLMCTVTIVRMGDADLVTFTSCTRSGSAVGRWENGFYHTDVPRDCDVSYFNEKFFGSDEVVKSNDLRLLNALYLEALEEIGREGRIE
jgi:hypothetical protein